MRVTERLIRQNQKSKDIRQKQAEEEGTLTYRERTAEPTLLNRQSSVFTHKDNSFHTQASVFDRTAVFHTKSKP